MTIRIQQTRQSQFARSTKIGALLLCCALPLYTASSAAQEQFFLSDDSAPVQTASTPDGKTRFAVHGAYAVTEGDIVLGNAFNLIHGKEFPRFMQRGLARTTKLDRWLNGIVYYQLTEELSEVDILKIDLAVEHWNEHTSITLRERNDDNAGQIPDYIHIIPGPGCGSYVGRIGGEQSLWVNSKCSSGSIIHEIGHAAGLFHEHTRADRDNFITIEWENIKADAEFNFDIITEGVAAVSPYDYGSVMHYGSTFFSKNGAATISAPDGVIIGQREGLSALDIAAIDALYATDLSMVSSTLINDESNELVIDVTISNDGPLGAHALTYTLPLNQNLAVSGFEGAGWSCNSNSSRIECDYPELANASSTGLSILIDLPPDAAALADQGYLRAKTFDPDLSNNGQLPPQTLDAAQSTPVPETTPTSPAQANPETADSSDKAAPGVAAASEQSASAGGGVAWPLLALGVLLRQRWRRMLDRAD